MIIETLRMVEAALLDVDDGLAVQIAALALDTPNAGGAPDARPTMPAIVTAVDGDRVVREVDDTFPRVQIDLATAATGAGEIFSGVRDHELDIVVAVMDRKDSLSANQRDVAYLLRAIVRALAHGLFASGKRATTATRNGYVISRTSRLRYGLASQDIKGAVMTGAVQFTLTVRDTQP